MKKTTVLLLSLVCAAGCLTHRIPRPKSDVDFTYKIGWWPYQDTLVVTSLTSEVVDSTLNLFNAKSIIRFKIKGSMQGAKGWAPRIEKIHLVEEVIRGGNFTNSLATVRLKPIIGVKQDKKYAGESVTYDVTQELVIHSMGWGFNSYQVTCGNITNRLELMQLK